MSPGQNCSSTCQGAKSLGSRSNLGNEVYLYSHSVEQKCTAFRFIGTFLVPFTEQANGILHDRALLCSIVERRPKLLRLRGGYWMHLVFVR
jgi:hypothetical protein